MCCVLNIAVIKCNGSEKQSNETVQSGSFDFRLAPLFTPAVSLLQHFFYSAHLHL